ncbi:hypothetical protein [uncultured Pseudomonas sp.]|uniref:hypothetical protein n=1 Tax=uncultured Pseudomonas sp. TaxID=114707 RepID=UPI002591DC98|nr:hypothetical protein [uncultured Pseudomonas sp.]
MTIYAGDAPVLDRRTMLDIPADSGEVWDAAFGGAYATNPTSSITRMQALEDEEVGAPQVGAGLGRLPSQRLAPDTPLLDAQAAREKVSGMGLDIKIPEQGIRQGALDILIDRHREQAARQQVMTRANGGSFGTQLGASVAASLLDPLNIASAFVPVVGEARYVAMLGRAASPLGRAGVRAGVGAVEGAVGAAIIEPLPLIAAGMDQTEYGLSDSLANIAMGGLLGGGLHTVGGAVSDALRRRIATETTPQVESVLNSTERQTPQPLRSTDFERIFDQDPETALRGALARDLEADGATLYRNAERAARDTIAAQREQIGARQAEINTTLERNRAGEFDRRDIGLIERGEVPERLRPQIEARAKQIMQGYQQRPLGPAIRTARETAQDADWTVRNSAFRTAVAQAVSGRDVDVQALFDLEAPGKAAGAMEYVKRPLARRVDPEGQAESLRVDSAPKSQPQDDFEATRQQFDEDEALVKEMLDQLPEQDRADVLAASRDEADAAQAQADRAEQYSKAYRAAAVCDIRNGQ